MNNRDIQRAIRLLREKADLNKLVVFVGAGVSKNVPGMPGWNDLVLEMAKAIGYSRCNTCRHKTQCKEKCPLVNDYSPDEYLKIPQYVFNSDEELYWKILRDNISDSFVSDVQL